MSSCTERNLLGSINVSQELHMWLVGWGTDRPLWIEEPLIRSVKRRSRGRVCSRIALKGPTVAIAVQKVDCGRAAGFRSLSSSQAAPCPSRRGCLNFVDNLEYLRHPSEHTSCIIYTQSAMHAWRSAGRSTYYGAILHVRSTHPSAAPL